MLIEYRNLKITNKNFKLEFDDFKIEENDRIRIDGVNGTGKTTLLNFIIGINKGFKIKADYKFVKDNLKVFFVPDSSVILFENLTVLETAKFLNISIDENLAVFENLNLTTAMKNIQIKNLSLGQRKKIILFYSFVVDADLFIYDEPFSGVDRKSLDYIKQKINEKKTLIFISHENSEKNDIKINRVLEL